MPNQMAAPSNISPQDANLLARRMIVSRGVKMTQQIFSQTVTPSTQNVINVAPRNVGLILGFWVEVTSTFTNADDTNDVTLTNFGPANVLSNISFYDLNNNVRINTSGWHLSLLNSARSAAPFLVSRTNTSYPLDFGNNFTNIIQAPSTIAKSTAGTVNMMYWVPLAYSEQDLRGAVYANVVNATMNLQLTINPAAVVASTLSPANAVYTGTTPDTSNTSTTITVYQVYYDQLPVGKNGVLLPMLDLATIYEMKNTTLTGLVANQDFPIPYSNFRDFLSTIAVYANGTELNDGSDINTVALQSANYTNIFKVTPKYISMWTRQLLQNDFPSATYYISSRQKPISTVQYGNMELVINPSTVNSGANVMVGYESFALVNVIGGAQSLAAN